MESLNIILNNLNGFKQNQRFLVNEKNNSRITDINDQFKRAKNLIDTSENFSVQLDEALNSIESYKHVIQKISDSNDEVKLPISHVEHNATTNFITDTMSFVNSLDINANSESATNITPSKINIRIQESIQDLRKEIQNCKFVTDNIEVMTNNMNIFENFSTTQLDTSSNGNAPLESIQE